MDYARAERGKREGDGEGKKEGTSLPEGTGALLQKGGGGVGGGYGCSFRHQRTS